MCNAERASQRSRSVSTGVTGVGSLGRVAGSLRACRCMSRHTTSTRSRVIARPWACRSHASPAVVDRQVRRWSHSRSTTAGAVEPAGRAAARRRRSLAGWRRGRGCPAVGRQGSGSRSRWVPRSRGMAGGSLVLPDDAGVEQPQDHRRVRAVVVAGLVAGAVPALASPPADGLTGHDGEDARGLGTCAQHPEEADVWGGWWSCGSPRRRWCGEAFGHDGGVEREVTGGTPCVSHVSHVSCSRSPRSTQDTQDTWRQGCRGPVTGRSRRPASTSRVRYVRRSLMPIAGPRRRVAVTGSRLQPDELHDLGRSGPEVGDQPQVLGLVGGLGQRA